MEKRRATDTHTHLPRIGDARGEHLREVGDLHGRVLSGANGGEGDAGK